MTQATTTYTNTSRRVHPAVVRAALRSHTVIDARGLTLHHRDQWFTSPRRCIRMAAPSTTNTTPPTATSSSIPMRTASSPRTATTRTALTKPSSSRTCEHVPPNTATTATASASAKPAVATPTRRCRHAICVRQHGNVITVTILKAAHRYTYDVMGDALTKTDPNGKVWSAATTKRSSAQRHRPAERTTSIAYTKAGLPSASTDAAGNTSTLGYDAQANC